MRNSVVEKIAGWWCKLVHDDPMWPVNGQYICRTCLRAHPVVWSNSVRPVLEPAAASSVLAELRPVKAES